MPITPKEASYVEGQDFTLIGSRSGANAIRYLDDFNDLWP